MVLARVFHNGRWFIGSSIRVSRFLRPLCLYNRILRFKRNLKKAIVFSKPLCIAGNKAVNWCSFAYKRKVIKTANETKSKPEKSYTEPKDPCQNCQMVFQNLEGFIQFIDCKDGGGEDEDEDEGSVSFLGACAEYCPVNELLVDDSEASSGADTDMLGRLISHRRRCTDLFNEYTKIADKCFDALESRENGKIEAIYTVVSSKVYIFGYELGCVMEL